MSSVTEPGVVVGVSGSECSVNALRWAAVEAHRRHRALTVVLAWEANQVAAYSPAIAHPDRDQQERTACHTLEVALRCAFGPVIPHSVIIRVTEGTPERVLVEESVGAELLVLGSGWARSLSGAYIGPVIRGCLGRAACPVVVIGPLAAPAPDDVREQRPMRTDHPAHQVVEVGEPVAV
jgi:nucleotide-binding universal stress UspA family protein